ncbi:MAG: HD domain-containing protein [Bdellovibrionota bacterium]
MSAFGKFLLIESDSKILELIQLDRTLSDQFPCHVVRHFGDARMLMERSKQEIRLIFVSEKLSRTLTKEEFEKFHADFKSTEMILIEDKTPFDVARNLIPRFIQAPKNYMDLAKHFQAQISGAHDWRKNKDDGQVKDTEFNAEEAKFIGLPLRDFVVTPKSYFNTYLKLTSGRFIKIINAGDELTGEFIKKYRDKGVEDFFVPKEEHEKYVHLLASLSAKTVSSEQTSAGFKIKTLVKLGKNITNNLSKCGITPERMDNAEMFLDQSITVLRHMKIKNDVISSYLQNIDKDEHSAAVAFIAGILANHLGFESSKSIKVVGTAALLHDLGLYSLDPHFNEADDAAKDENGIFAKHAAHGAEILRSTGMFDEVICNAIENHHRRRRGENSNRRSSSVNLVTEIICVSDEFFNTVIYPGYSPERVKYFMDSELKNYSPNVERAFQALTKGKKAA